jgi:hypothetical protein
MVAALLASRPLHTQAQLSTQFFDALTGWPRMLIDPPYPPPPPISVVSPQSHTTLMPVVVPEASPLGHPLLPVLLHAALCIPFL